MWRQTRWITGMLRQEAEPGSYTRATTPLGSSAQPATDRAGLAHLLEGRPHFAKTARSGATSADLARELSLAQRAPDSERESRGAISGAGDGPGAAGTLNPNPDPDPDPNPNLTLNLTLSLTLT